MLDFYKYKERLKDIFPKIPDKELEKHFYNLVKYWKIYVDNIDEIKKKSKKLI